MKQAELLRYIQQQYKGKQAYQTVEYQGKIIFRGTERCWLSWENIQKLGIAWKGKTVLDVGSYFGYFSTKVLSAGAKEVVALDQNEDLLGVCRTVLKANGFGNFQTVARKLSKTETELPQGFDITLVLNCLHHIKKASGSEYNTVLKNLFSSARELVFEVNLTEVPDLDGVSSGFSKAVEKSHRRNRQILHFKRK